MLIENYFWRCCYRCSTSCSKQGKGWALFTIEDYTDTYEFRIFGEEYLKFRHFYVKILCLCKSFYQRRLGK